jgi:hypothetical protein
MYVGIAPPPSGRRAYTGELVVIEERAPEKEQGRDDKDGEERRRPQRGRAPRAKREEQDVGRQKADKRECCQRTNRMREIGAGELDGAAI